MHETITLAPTPETALATDLDGARELAKAARASATTRAYDSDWRAFRIYCGQRDARALPADPHVVAAYVSALDARGRKPATIARALVAISQAHKLAGFASPTSDGGVRETVKGLRNTRGTAQTAKSPILVDALREMVRTLDGSLIGLRDRALLVLGFAGAFRRSELVALEVADLAFVREGLVVTLRRSKTDQHGEGRKVGVPFGSDPATCPVRAVREWLDAAKVTEGRVLRSVDRHGHVGEGLTAQAVALVVKRSASNVGVDASTVAGHSLRAGLATSAAKAGKGEREIMRQTGHRSVSMVRRYIRDASLFDANAAQGIGL